MYVRRNSTEGNPIMNSKKATFFACFGLLGVSAILLGASFFTARTPVSAHAVESTPAYDFIDHETEADPRLSVKATAATKTTIGASFTFAFSTGGTGFQDSTKTFTVAPTDPDFDSYFDEFSKLTPEEKEEIEEAYERGEYETKLFNGQIYALLYQNSNQTIYVPETLSRGIFFKFELDSIVSDALTNEEANKGVKKVVIPKGITNIYLDSFGAMLPADLEFDVEYEQSEIPSTWATGWNHGQKVNYGVTIDQKKKDVRIAGSTVEYGDKDANFIIGYYPLNAKQYPLVMTYRLSNSPDVERYFEFTKSTSSSIGSIYDAVGYRLYGFSNSLFADIEVDLPDGVEILYDTVRIHNIFEALEKTSESGAIYYVPDFEHPQYINPSKSFSKTFDITDFINYNFSGVSSFGGYTAIDLNVDQAGDGTYQKIKSSFYNQYKSDIESGRVYIRYRLTSLTNCNFKATYASASEGKDVDKVVPIATPVPQFVLQAKTGNSVSFLFKNSDISREFDAKSVRALKFIPFYITLDLFNTSAGNVIARSNYTARFSYMLIMPRTENAPVFDINMMLVILSASYVAAYAVLSVVAFFYFKNKYKNDEFRRIKPKSYWLKAVLGLFGSAIVILCITFIVIRSTAFNNAIVVYNPVDAYIIVTAVASVLIIGYFIKYLVGVSKANKDRKRNIKLKLNQDVAEDGTK